jgi:hypothetical protein
MKLDVKMDEKVRYVVKYAIKLGTYVMSIDDVRASEVPYECPRLGPI